MKDKRIARALAENLRALGVREIVAESRASALLGAEGPLDVTSEEDLSREAVNRRETQKEERSRKCRLG